MNIVFDLDGTLCRVNTYKHFVIIFFIFLVVTFQFSKIYKLITILIRRIQKKENRWSMKCKVGLLYYDLRCVGIIDKLLLFWFKKFIRKSLLAQYVNKSINTVALATAAFSFYANPLGESLGLIPIFATEKGDLANDVECLSEVKASRVRNYFRDEVDLFFTDHYDDLPTIRIAKKTVLVNPSSLSKDRILASLEEERIEFYNY